MGVGWRVGGGEEKETIIRYKVKIDSCIVCEIGWINCWYKNVERWILICWIEIMIEDIRVDLKGNFKI